MSHPLSRRSRPNSAASRVLPMPPSPTTNLTDVRGVDGGPVHQGRHLLLPAGKVRNFGLPTQKREDVGTFIEILKRNVQLARRGSAVACRPSPQVDRNRGRNANVKATQANEIERDVHARNRQLDTGIGNSILVCGTGQALSHRAPNSSSNGQRPIWICSSSRLAKAAAPSTLSSSVPRGRGGPGRSRSAGRSGRSRSSPCRTAPCRRGCRRWLPARRG